MTSGVSLEALLTRPVVLHGIRLGQAHDVVLDDECLRVVGIEVLCGDDVRRFLPLPAARIRAQEIAVGSALLLLEEPDLDFYGSRTRTFRSLHGAMVERRGKMLGELRDLVIGEDGEVLAVEVGSGHVRRGGGVVIAERSAA